MDGRTAINEIIAFADAMNAREDFDKGRFSRAVIAEKAVNFTGHNIETEVLQCKHASEGLRYISELKNGFHLMIPSALGSRVAARSC